MIDTGTTETGCCPRFNTDLWQEKEVKFDNKLFVKDHISAVFHIPLNFGNVVKRNMEKIDKAHAAAAEQLMLTKENSLWRTDIYIAVKKGVPDTEVKKISGNFLSKVFEGPYKNMGQYIDAMKKYVHRQGKQYKDLWFYYPYCPACAKAYGKNYIVILAETK